MCYRAEPGLPGVAVTGPARDSPKPPHATSSQRSRYNDLTTGIHIASRRVAGSPGRSPRTELVVEALGNAVAARVPRTTDHLPRRLAAKRPIRSADTLSGVSGLHRGFIAIELTFAGH